MGDVQPHTAPRVPPSARLIRAGASLLFAATFVWFLTVAPDNVPAHFGPGGTVNRWESRSGLAFSLMGLASAFMLLFGVLPRVIVRFPPRQVNLPHAEYWLRPEHRDRLISMLRFDCAMFTAVVLVLLSWVIVASAFAAGNDEALPPVLLGAPILLAVAVLIGYVIWKYAGPKYAIPEEDPSSTAEKLFE